MASRSTRHCCHSALVGFCIGGILVVGCESVPVRPINPDPAAEYQAAQKEYNDALSYLAQARSNKVINDMNSRLGTFQGSSQAQALGTTLDLTANLGEVDALQKVEAARQRLDAARMRLDQHIYVHQGKW